MSCSCHHDHCKTDKGEKFYQKESFKRGLVITRLVVASILLIVWNVIKFDSAITLALAITAYVIVSYDVALAVIIDFKEKEFFSEHLLMLVATIGAFVISEYNEGIFVMLFYQIGELLEDYAEDRSKESVEKLIDNMPLYAHVINGEDIVESTPEKLKIGDLIKVLPGEKIPVDGIVTSGKTSVDMSSLNGESIPVTLNVNDSAISGSIVIDGTIVIKVVKTYEDSTLKQILDLITQEETKKSKPERFISKFSKYYTPLVILAALVYFLVAYGLAGWGANYRDALYNACTILIISCPCALVVSVPLSFFLGIGRAGKFNVLVKGANYIESMSKCRQFFFDKTGTLTQGKFVLKEVSSDETLTIAASLEANSTHPLAKAVVEAYKGKLKPVENFQNLPGKGIKGDINQTTYFIGDYSYLCENCLEKVEKLSSPFKCLYVFTQDRCLGYLILADQVKPSAIKLAEDMKEQAELVILSGDNKQIVEATKQELGFSKAYGELLPQDKLDVLKQSKQSGVIAFVGDGVNDAPALLSADIGIAMGGLGSDVAKQSAGVIILNDDLEKISKFQRLSKKVMKISLENIVLILLVKFAVFVFAMLPFEELYGIKMYLASFADVGTLILSIVNSLRIFYSKKE